MPVALTAAQQAPRNLLREGSTGAGEEERFMGKEYG